MSDTRTQLGEESAHLRLACRRRQASPAVPAECAKPKNGAARSTRRQSESLWQRAVRAPRGPALDTGQSQRRASAWPLVFHQGTRIAEDRAPG